MIHISKIYSVFPMAGELTTKPVDHTPLLITLMNHGSIH